MVALNFKAEFADDVENGFKRRTIRKPRKNGRDPKAGDMLQLYTGMRTALCYRLDLVKCRRVRSVEIDHTGVVLDGKVLFAGDSPAYQGMPDTDGYDGDFARADGFACFGDMADFFDKLYGLPFSGVLIEW